MAYTKTVWTNSSGSPINDVNLNKIEQGIKDAHTDIESLNSSVSAVYNKTETDNLLDDKADTATTYTKTEVDTNIYTKTEVDTNIYTKTQADTLLSAKLANVVEDTTPQLGGALDTNSNIIKWSKGADIVSSSNITLGTDGNYFDITGTTAITGISTTGTVGTLVKLHFDDILTLTYNISNFILPTMADIVTAAGDEAEFIEYSSGLWRCTGYTRASGEPLAGGGAISTAYLMAYGGL